MREVVLRLRCGSVVNGKKREQTGADQKKSRPRSCPLGPAPWSAAVDKEGEKGREERRKKRTDHGSFELEAKIEVPRAADCKEGGGEVRIRTRKVVDGATVK